MCHISIFSCWGMRKEVGSSFPRFSLTKSFPSLSFWRTIPVSEEAHMFRRNPPVACRFSAAAFSLVLLSISPMLLSNSTMAQPAKSVTLELDHVSVCGANLDPLRQAFTDVGLVSDFGGPHGNGVTQMAGIGFDD